METILFLCHRIPYPPNKGDKIRAFNFLKYLSTRFNIILATFVDDPEDAQYVSELNKYCSEVLAISLNTKLARIKSLGALLSGESLSSRYYQNAQMKAWVQQKIVEKQIGQAFVYCSSMASYVNNLSAPNLFKVLDLVDIDSSKWREFADLSKWPMSQLYRRESNFLFKEEKECIDTFDASLLVSEDEVNEYRSRVSEGDRVPTAIPNGVDTDYFDPELVTEKVYDSEVFNIVFTGVMDYKPNVDAVTYFAERVVPRIKKQGKRICFHIVGSSPSSQVKKLAEDEFVRVLGRVEDVRPYLKCADIAVAPLLTARGIQNKVLEAMAMSKPIVITPLAHEGIGDFPHQANLVADGEEQFASKVLSLADSSENDQMGCDLRNFVIENYSWESAYNKFGQIFRSN